jgi:hypothetical protein
MGLIRSGREYIHQERIIVNQTQHNPSLWDFLRDNWVKLEPLTVAYCLCVKESPLILSKANEVSQAVIDDFMQDVINKPYELDYGIEINELWRSLYRLIYVYLVKLLIIQPVRQKVATNGFIEMLPDYIQDKINGKRVAKWVDDLIGEQPLLSFSDDDRELWGRDYLFYCYDDVIKTLVNETEFMVQLLPILYERGK